MNEPIINVEVKIYEDACLRYPYNSYSDRHLCIGGASRERCRFVAQDVAEMRLEANRKPGCTRWTNIEFAICPHSTEPGLFIIEDRSKHS